MLRRLCVLLGLIAFCDVGYSQAPGDPADDANRANVRAEARKLILADAKNTIAANAVRAAAMPATKPDVVAMSAFIVRERKPPKPVVVTRESATVYYLRTGKLIESVGKKVTTTLRLTATPSFGFAGAQISLGFSW